MVSAMEKTKQRRRGVGNVGERRCHFRSRAYGQSKSEKGIVGKDFRR